jgi:hypothetical protein
MLVWIESGTDTNVLTNAHFSSSVGRVSKNIILHHTLYISILE